MPQPRDFIRFTPAAPKGSLSHAGDCHIYSASSICTCGLLHVLETQLNAEILYPDFKKDYVRHEDALHALARLRRYSIVDIMAWAHEHGVEFADPKDKPKP
jgi:hypothetical protein